MTSLDFFNHRPKTSEEPEEWGTGKLKDKEHEALWTPKAPTWQYSGHPIEQHYGLTKLKLSNVRLNDQLLPNPQHSDMHKLTINKAWPAEHPYASHEERKAVFPKFDSPEDYKRGVDARRQRPKNDEMPSMPYDVIIISKTKGSARRHELQALPDESQKAPLLWPENTFDQQVKSPNGGQQSFYPTPPKTLVPNLENRSDGKCIKGNMAVSDSTANALRNVERNQWHTTYNRNHTGLGPSNTMVLDNLDKKQHSRAVGVLDQSIDQLEPHFVNKFDPARPKEGRIARAITPRPAPQTNRWPNPENDPNYERLRSLTEREEDRLWNGFRHRNYPETDDEEQEWWGQQTRAHPESGVNCLAVNHGSPDPVPYRPQVGPASGTPSGPIEQMAVEQHNKFQQVESQNRWQLLGLQKPQHNVKARQHKINMAVDKEQPKVFYDHEGQYQEERAGMYSTSYDPYKLQETMNRREDSGSYKFDISEIHKDALNLPVQLNNDMHDAMRKTRSLGGPPGSVSQLHSQPSPYEAIEPFNTAKAGQKAKIQPKMATADAKTLEGEFVLRESTMGDDYNTERFLQEYSVSGNARKEALALMSHENQDLGRVRAIATPKRVTWSSHCTKPSTSNSAESGKRVTWSASNQIATGGNDEPLRASYSGSDVRNTPLPALHTPRGAISARDAASQQVSLNQTRSTNEFQLPVTLENDRRNKSVEQRNSRFGADDQFASKSTTFTGPSEVNWGTRSSYADLHSGPHKVDMSFKIDRRFDWKAGSGTPRQQTSLLQLQNAFTKSDARKKFHRQFYEMNPDLRENIFRGRQHEFDGMNAQVLRGTPIDSY